jgi:seryl-tRNA synthetase
MAEYKPIVEIAQLFEKVAPLIAQQWSSRAAKKVAAKALSLQFWEDGMLKELKLIADKKASSKDFANLQLKFDDTEKEVNKIVKELQELRSALIERHYENGAQMIRHIGGDPL